MARQKLRTVRRRVKRAPKRGSFNKNSMRREVAVGLGY